MKLNFYIISQFLRIFFAIFGLALLMLLLERTVRIMQLILDKNQSIVSTLEIIATLLPHYLAIALPLAFILSIIVITYRLSIAQEITALKTLGLSHFQIARPFFVLAVILCFFSFLILGFAKPMGRYYYRVLVNQLSNTEVFLLAKDGVFLQHKDSVLMIEEVSSDQRTFKKVFLHQAKGPHTKIIVAKEGVNSTPTQIHDFPLVKLKEGHIFEIHTALASQKTPPIFLPNSFTSEIPFPAIKETKKESTLSLSSIDSLTRPASFSEIKFDTIYTHINPTDTTHIAPRGSDIIEFYISELFSTIVNYHSPTHIKVISSHEYSRHLSEFLHRLSNIFIFPILVLLTFPMAIVNSRHPRYGKIIVSILVFILFHKIIDNAKNWSSDDSRNTILLQLGIYFSFLSLSLIIFIISNYTVPGIVKSRLQHLWYTYIFQQKRASLS